tara:strand:- start:40 stop:426 length:387 start_codon:yes stop_codon:yes gene_type:complete
MGVYKYLGEMNANENSAFCENMKEYLELENKIEELNLRMKTLKLQKQMVHEKIADTIALNQWQNKQFQVNNYKLSMVDKKQYSSLTFSYLEEQLQKIIPDNNERDYLIKYLKNNRSIKSIQELRYIKK